MSRLLWIAFAAVLCSTTLAPRTFAGEPYAPTAEAGETKLDDAAAKTALDTLADNFKKQPAFKAKITSEADDELLGKTTKTGEFLMDRPGKLLRRFAKPPQAMRLSGTVLSEYDGSTKKTNERDFAAAPKALSLLRAAFTFDFNALKDYFTVHVFQTGASGAKTGQLRLVLVPRPEKKFPLKFEYIQARVNDGAAFFYEIERMPKKGSGQDRVLEKFTDITPGAVPEADFAEALLDNSPKNPQPVKELED